MMSQMIYMERYKRKPERSFITNVLMTLMTALVKYAKVKTAKIVLILQASLFSY